MHTHAFSLLYRLENTQDTFQAGKRTAARKCCPPTTLLLLPSLTSPPTYLTPLADCNVVATWGRGEDGQLGHGDAEQCVEPKAVAALLDQDIDSICCGAEYTVAVSRKQQRVYSWGW